jgi:hypothetical protein
MAHYMNIDTIAIYCAKRPAAKQRKTQCFDGPHAQNRCQPPTSLNIYSATPFLTNCAQSYCRLPEIQPFTVLIVAF